jgi:hypothetical protein
MPLPLTIRVRTLEDRDLLYHLVIVFGDVCVHDDVRAFLAELNRRRLDLTLDVCTTPATHPVLVSARKSVRDAYDM